jgi:hypothetical protein
MSIEGMIDDMSRQASDVPDVCDRDNVHGLSSEAEL